MEEEGLRINNGKMPLLQKDVNSQISLRSEMVQEIISKKEGFIERWALVFFLGILLLLLALTWFIKYPDIIEARAILTAANAPKEIVSRQDGRLVRLFKSNSEEVERNEVFGWIESTANHEEVLALSNEIDSSNSFLISGQFEKASALFYKHYSNLGEIQQEYQNFIAALQLFNDYTVNGFYSRRKKILKDDIQSLKDANRTILHQESLAKLDIQLAEETYNMNKELFEEKVLSKEELRVEHSKFVNKQMSLPQIRTLLLSNESQVRVKINEMDQLEHDMAQQTIVFQQALQTLKSSVDDWKKRFILQSPIKGKIFFIIPLQENQFLQSGRLLGYVNPYDSHFYAEAYLPQNNLGKVDTGLKVQLRFDAYPFQEVGFVPGTLDYISSVASDSGFLATIRLDSGLVTNNKKSIPYKNRLKAQAIVITNNMRLFERLNAGIIKTISTSKK